MTNIYEDILYDYQKKVVNEAMKFDKYFLAMEPGLGKTLTTEAIVQIKKHKNILVVCQKSKIWDWQDDIEKFLGMKTYVLEGNKVKDVKTLNNFTEGAVIASYQTIWRRDVPLDESFALVVDESQYLKSHKTSVGVWGVEASNKVKTVLLLSGTPLNKPEDLFNQMKMMGMEMDWKEFADAFLIEALEKFPGARFPTKVIKGYINQDILNAAFAAQSYALRTTDAIDLPKQTFIDIRLKHEKRKLYDTVKRKTAYKDMRFESAGTLFLRLRELTSGFISDYGDLGNHKKEALRDLLESTPENFVVFYNFVNELADIKKIAGELGIKVFECNGSIKNHEESKSYQGRFIIAGQYQSAAEGMNWQHVTHQLYYSPPVSFMKYKQSQARIHRVGQKKPVFYYRFKTMGTIDIKIYNNLEQGKDFNEKVFVKKM